MNRKQVLAWIDAYERAWRSSGTSSLAELFTEDASYSTRPYDKPYVGLAAIQAMWETHRDGPDEAFRMTREIVAVQGNTAVARLEVWFGDPVTAQWRDLWVLRFAADGRCQSYEEWPFAPRKRR